MGVKTMGSTQIAFVDAPGIVGKEHYRNAAHARKVENAFEMAMDCDAVGVKCCSSGETVGAKRSSRVADDASDASVFARDGERARHRRAARGVGAEQGG